MNVWMRFFKIMPVHMEGKRGGKVVAPSCNFRFEIYPFYDPLPPDAPSPTNFPPLPPPTTGNGMHRNYTLWSKNITCF